MTKELSSKEDKRRKIIDAYVFHVLEKHQRPVRKASEELGLTTKEVFDCISSAAGRLAIENRIKQSTESLGVIRARISFDANELLGLSPLDIIDVGNFPGGYRLKKDVSKSAWNLVKSISPSKREGMPPALTFLNLPERVDLNLRLAKEFDEELRGGSLIEKGILDGGIIDAPQRRVGTLLPASFSEIPNSIIDVDCEVTDIRVDKDGTD
jgi:hypothetical protein